MQSLFPLFSDKIINVLHKQAVTAFEPLTLIHLTFSFLRFNYVYNFPGVS